VALAVITVQIHGFANGATMGASAAGATVYTDSGCKIPCSGPGISARFMQQVPEHEAGTSDFKIANGLVPRVRREVSQLSRSGRGCAIELRRIALGRIAAEQCHGHAEVDRAFAGLMFTENL
jgi:hypothetical protein